MDAKFPEIKNGGPSAGNGAVVPKRKRIRLTAEESLRRTADFHTRREKLIATIREGKD